MNIRDLERQQLQNRLDLLRSMRYVEITLYGMLATTLATVALVIVGMLQ